MISDAELTELFVDRASERVEKTISVTNTDKFCEAICAFSNDFSGSKAPGYLLVGVRDDGVVGGIQVTESLLQSLAAIRTDGNVIPMPQLSVCKRKFPGGEIAVVEVLPSDLPPVRYKGRTFIRVGPRRAIATVEEEKRLIERRVSQAKTRFFLLDVTLLRLRTKITFSLISSTFYAHSRRSSNGGCGLVANGSPEAAFEFRPESVRCVVMARI